MQPWRLIQLASVFGAQPHASLPQASHDPAMLKAAYRFFDNDAIRDEAILASHIASTQRRMQTVPVVLAVQDTTTLDWTTCFSSSGLQGSICWCGPPKTAKRKDRKAISGRRWRRHP